MRLSRTAAEISISHSAENSAEIILTEWCHEQLTLVFKALRSPSDWLADWLGDWVVYWSSWVVLRLAGYWLLSRPFTCLPAASRLYKSQDRQQPHKRTTHNIMMNLMKLSILPCAEKLEYFVVVTCEIKLFWNNFEIISVPCFTRNHVWNYFKVISATLNMWKNIRELQ